MEQETILALKQRAFLIREDIVRTARDCEFGIHIGGALSLAEILSVLYFHIMKVDPGQPKMPDRDRLILSKGHGNAGLAVALAQRGFFPVEELLRFDGLGALLSMHVDSHRQPGAEISSGSLGHGLPISVGLALAGKLDSAPWKVYCIVGDGEIMEGSNWEAMMSAAHYKLDNLIAVLDRNRFSLDGPTEEIMSLEPLVDKIKAFGWHTIEVDGHDVAALLNAFQEIRSVSGKPKMIIANTIKAKGVSFLENTTGSHFAHLSSEKADIALGEIEAERQSFIKELER
jgi:transketolase